MRETKKYSGEVMWFLIGSLSTLNGELKHPNFAKKFLALRKDEKWETSESTDLISFFLIDTPFIPNANFKYC
jgi:hypothetical protein